MNNFYGGTIVKNALDPWGDNDNRIEMVICEKNEYDNTPTIKTVWWDAQNRLSYNAYYNGEGLELSNKIEHIDVCSLKLEDEIKLKSVSKSLKILGFYMNYNKQKAKDYKCRNYIEVYDILTGGYLFGSYKIFKD